MATLEQLRVWTGEINALANGYKKSQILFTALNAGVFELLQAPANAKTVADALGWSLRGVAMLLDGLVAIDLLEKDAGQYRNTTMASVCLASRGEAYQGHILCHSQNSWNAWADLSERVRTGTCTPQGEERSGGELRNFILGMSNIAVLSAAEVLQAVDLSPFRHLLDLACGPGSYAIRFMQENPELRATLFDRDVVLEMAREQVQLSGLEERTHFIAGDCLQDSLGEGYDLALMSNIVHSFNAAENALLVTRVYDALAPGGTLIIKDFILDENRSGPAYGLIFALHMLVHTPEGNTYTFDEIQDWTTKAGFVNGRAFALTPQTRLWIVEKP